jgi:hypothetical protein
MDAPERAEHGEPWQVAADHQRSHASPPSSPFAGSGGRDLGVDDDEGGASAAAAGAGGGAEAKQQQQKQRRSRPQQQRALPASVEKRARPVSLSKTKLMSRTTRRA